MALFLGCIDFGQYKLNLEKYSGWLTIPLVPSEQALFYHTVKIIYSIFLHPLRNFPGPLAHRASRLPWAYLHATGRQAFRTERLHAQYGPVVRIGPNHLSFTDPGAWKDIYAYRASGEMAKADQFFRPVKGVPSSILNADHEEHSRIRRALSHGFSDSSMRAQEPLISQYVKLLVERLTQESADGKSIQNIAAWYNWTTFDLASDLVFGESFHCLETVNYHPWVAYILKAVKFHAVIIALRYSGLGIVVNMLHVLGGFLALSKIQEYTNSMLKSRLGMGKGRNDLFEGLAKKQEEWNLSFEKLSRNATILLLAGSETTATTLSGATYFLLSNPEILQRLKKEIRSAFANSDEITIASVGKCSYLLAVLNETLRCYPPLTAGMVRVVPAGGAEVAQNFVPQGTLVEIQHWSVNHSAENWKDPWVFRPERFMPESKEALANQNRLDSVQAFSVGPRNCIGRNLAYTEMRLILAHIIYKFDMELEQDGHGWIDRQRAFNVWDRGPLNVRLYAREGTCQGS
ncbi:putative cytochrome P450 [Clohesyomyces aquaticus]|uniref:Putative cytochrome P450 n=1 Tax=Clohesyomyces aquaticus TaxID=1231657 RepID=A0A1Y1YXN9_9PLEO|nr:putative cytochrome P450 [Clohesyomyces aquaticus]